MLLSLTYVSSATELLDEAQLDRLLEEIRPVNEANGLTGLLLYCDGNIIQLLEGEAPAVHGTFASIERDPRHRGVLLLTEDPIDERRFPDWSMGYERIDRAHLADPEGYSSYLADQGGSERRAWEADRGAAVHLLRTFRDSMTR